MASRTGVEHPDWTQMTVGIPLAILKEPGGEHEVVLNFSGVRWTMYVDGRLLDNDFPVGQPRWPAKAEWKLDPESTASRPSIRPSIRSGGRPGHPRSRPTSISAVPAGKTTRWAGRRGVLGHTMSSTCMTAAITRASWAAASRLRRLCTSDFRTWTEHEAATPLEEQWECVGHGRALRRRRQALPQLRPAHDAQSIRDEKTSLPLQWDYLKKHGRTRGTKTGPRRPGSPPGQRMPRATTAAGSFRKSNILFTVENPSVYVDPGGKLK